MNLICAFRVMTPTILEWLRIFDESNPPSGARYMRPQFPNNCDEDLSKRILQLFHSTQISMSSICTQLIHLKSNITLRLIGTLSVLRSMTMNRQVKKIPSYFYLHSLLRRQDWAQSNSISELSYGSRRNWNGIGTRVQ